MKTHRPSPALVISIVALVVALGGTATAASVLIRDSSQIRSGAVNSGDIRNGSVQGVDIRSGAVGGRQLKNNAVTQNKLSASLRNSLRGGGSGFTATEVVRKVGPDKQAPGQRVVATMTQLPAGTYVLSAKTTLSPVIEDQGLLGEILRDIKTGEGHCLLDAAGDVDDARTTILSPYSQHPSTINLQMTRTIDKAIDVKLVCDSNIQWKASDTSIIALRLQGSSRSDTAG